MLRAVADAPSRGKAGIAFARPTIVMCAPTYYGVDYVINPWMEHQLGNADHAVATRQWSDLRLRLETLADLEFIAPQPSLPDMVFTANAGLVIGGKAIVSRFRTMERRGEEPFFHNWFERRGFEIAPWPENVAFEGAGDALLDRGRPLIWCGHGFRTSADAPSRIEKIFERQTIALRLVDPRFYHLDTCFCPLSGSRLLYYPQAFDKAARTAIATFFPNESRIEVDERDAFSFACNAVEVGGRIFMNDASQALQAQLRDFGLEPEIAPLSEFLKAGGGAKCLTLRLDEA
jgi:N-dimethylarginine dimethylaminohydrolase